MRKIIDFLETAVLTICGITLIVVMLVEHMIYNIVEGSENHKQNI